MKLELTCRICGGKKFLMRATGWKGKIYFRRYECKRCYKKGNFVNIEVRYDDELLKREHK